MLPQLTSKASYKPQLEDTGTIVSFSKTKVSMLTVLSFSCIFVIWWYVANNEIVPEVLLPSPNAIAHKLIDLITNGYLGSTLVVHAMASLGRVLIALSLVLLSAIPLGILVSLNRVAKAIIEPIIELIRPVPPLAYLPLLIIWFGIGEFSKILLIYLAIFPAVIMSVVQGVRNVSQQKLRVAQSLGASYQQQVTTIIIPSILPSIYSGLRIGLGVGWSTLVAAELIAATRGLGFMIQSAAQFLVTDVVIVGILVISLIAFSMEFMLRKAQHYFIPWLGLVD